MKQYYHSVHIIEDSPENAERKKLAAEAAIESLMSEMLDEIDKSNSLKQSHKNMSESDDSDDSEDSYMKDAIVTVGRDSNITEKARSLPYSRRNVEAFIHSLRYNLIFSVGFDVIGINPDDEISCYCPCSKAMDKWRNNFNLQFIITKDECQNFHKAAKPKGLMDHIKQVGSTGGYLHRGIELYLDNFYRNKWGNIGHKALYNIGDNNYNLAVAAESKHKHR